MREALEVEAAALGIRDDCVFARFTDQVTDWLRAIDIFVLPSVSEALSNGLMEAMACGCAVIASKVGGNPELVRDGETGLLFEPGDAGGLAAALATLIQNEARRKKMAAAGTAFIQEHFSIHAAAQRMGEIYSQLIARRR